jgi:tRNA (guanine37-N1)-methyltransferase
LEAWLLVLLSAQGRLFDQSAAERLAGFDEVVLVCGRYEGVDKRVAEHLAAEELLIGNFMLSGGVWAAGVVGDTFARLCPGVVGNEASTTDESLALLAQGGVGILDRPQHTRPAHYESPSPAWEFSDVPGCC